MLLRGLLVKSEALKGHCIMRVLCLAGSVLGLFLLPCFFVGCAVRDAAQTERYFWPQPPERPRIEWLGGYQSQLDLPMTSSRRIKELLVGEDAAVVMKQPVDIRVDAKHDKAYIADLGAASVFVFDFHVPEVRTLSFDDAGLPGSVKAVSLALDGNDNLYVMEPRYSKILVYNSSEKFAKSIDIKTLKRPIALAIDKKRSRLYVADLELSRINVFDLDGRFLFAFAGPGDAAGQLNRPVGMCVNSRGELLVAEAFNARIQIFDSHGKFVRVFGARGTGESQFQLIKGVAVDSDDNVYVIDGRSNNIKIFSDAGAFLLALGDYYVISSSGKAAPGGFALPVGIDIDRRNRIFVVDQLNARMQMFQYFSESGSGGFDAPQGVK